MVVYCQSCTLVGGSLSCPCLWSRLWGKLQRRKAQGATAQPKEQVQENRQMRGAIFRPFDCNKEESPTGFESEIFRGLEPWWINIPSSRGFVVEDGRRDRRRPGAGGSKSTCLSLLKKVHRCRPDQRGQAILGEIRIDAELTTTWLGKLEWNPECKQMPLNKMC